MFGEQSHVAGLLVRTKLVERGLVSMKGLLWIPFLSLDTSLSNIEKLDYKETSHGVQSCTQIH
jgi:hypothetical protein